MPDDGFEAGPDPSYAERILELSDLPSVDPEDRRGSVGSLSPSTAGFMESLVNQLPAPQAPDRPSRSDPFSAYLQDTAHQIKRGARELRETARRDLAQSRVGAVVCCIVNAIYRIVLNQSGREATYEAMREVPKDDVVRWLRVFRDMLINVRQAGMGRASIAGFQLNLLSVDVGATIYRAVETVLVGLMVAFLSWVEKKIGQLHRRLADDLESTRCRPLIRLWSSVLNWLYDQSRGLVSRLRGFVQDVIIRMHRKIQGMMQDVPANAGGDVSLAGDSRRFQSVDDIILVLDALIGAVDVFRICRLPPPGQTDGGAEEENRTGIRDGEDDGGGGSGEDDRDRGRTGTRPDPSRLTESFDPDLGRVSTLEVRGPSGDAQDTIYLTPTNVAKVLTQEFGLDAEQAQTLAAEQSCREELSDETESILEEIGLFSE